MTEINETIQRFIGGPRGKRVLTGPFAGMCYETEAVHSAHLPRLLGTYERELHPALERVLGRSYPRVINIGCGEGYYAVGLAVRLPEAHVHAFDSEPRARELCKALAAANGVGKRVHLHEACSIEALQNLLIPGCLILCDCEGCEIDLLRPGLLPILNECDLLVELHDNNGLNASGQLIPRFRFSHSLQVIPAVERAPEEFDTLLDQIQESETALDVDLPGLRELTDAEKVAALNEGRYDRMRWLSLSAAPIPNLDVKPKRAAKSAAPHKTNAHITGCILARNEAGNIEAAMTRLLRLPAPLYAFQN